MKTWLFFMDLYYPLQTNGSNICSRSPQTQGYYSQRTDYSSPHDDHRSSGPRPVKLCSDQSIFHFFLKNYIKINSRIWFGSVNSNF